MIDAASSGSTVRLGHLLAPAGVRYIAFVTRGRAGRRCRAAATRAALADALARQLDLTLSRSDDAGVVYQNDAWIPRTRSCRRQSRRRRRSTAAIR